MVNLLAVTYAAGHMAEDSSKLGLSLSSLVIQFVTFVLVFLLLKRFAFKPIVKMLEKRRQTIEDGVKLGEKMEKEQERLKEEEARIIREARHQADRIVETGHKEAREVVRDAEKAAKVKADGILAEAEERIAEESEQARRKLEKDIVGLVSEATETIVEEKVDASKDADLIDRAMKGRKQQ
jgi:F-type H+-transporting ATPase subunit b